LAALPEERRETRSPQVTIEPSLPELVADRDALVMVLLNLLDNAYKYSPPDAPITLRVFRERRAVVFAVEDRASAFRRANNGGSSSGSTGSITTVRRRLLARASA
jgi:signal transduction histidine kinase